MHKKYIWARFIFLGEGEEDVSNVKVTGVIVGN